MARQSGSTQTGQHVLVALGAKKRCAGVAQTRGVDSLWCSSIENDIKRIVVQASVDFIHMFV